ncbi:hypothetical protein OS493_034642 [Desmophyllum pertusum]|uniref:Uncharacterized protein n=1 Tax=Desmophyllum pertusum TaxID=174260 RepID=A0A9X0D0R1_9CNID|nr:hypothetical protein OS493_034642 [Desmophyllum pertusum]
MLHEKFNPGLMMTHFKTSARTIFIIISLIIQSTAENQCAAKSPTTKDTDDTKPSLVDCSVPVPIVQYPATKETNDQQLQGILVGVSLAFGPCNEPNGSYEFQDDKLSSH